ncbi:MAG: hypothetical protein RJA36_1870 [Pseudomonadota bacterium]|jgi:hypothetical protein
MTITKTIPLGSLQGPTFPWSELRGFVDQINASEPAHQENISCVLEGGTLSAAVLRALTPQEEVVEMAAEADKLRQALRNLRHPDGTLVEDADARLKALGF